ncbi:hypothetical protein EW146_g5715 [Bondarzewia mesenterica]|uniref:SWI5-dependent HO expression protein 3 n=1 Tax=Bondarzewia mesenterica TaxID=1095465 RepID=A0A4S4LR96_9AGAM|nr:hypothetical protein EW146_g5715 [Bondarzewia mesenterica]
MYSPPASPIEREPLAAGTPTSNATKRRSSYDVLQSLAGPDSNIPLPRRESGTFSSLGQDGIREGIPMDFSAGPSSSPFKRTPSPTRTLSRIPVASVVSSDDAPSGNARVLADDGRPPSRTPIPIDAGAANSSFLSLQPPSPNFANRRISLTPGGTTKVLADLQTGVAQAKNALENTKAQLRLSQRSVAQLTRQTEDLKEVRERLRLENEGLNNVVARKERLLQEVLERARKAEAEATALRTQLKSESATMKKSLREMEATLAESTALSSKSEREYITLRDSLRDMKESWQTDTDALREEMRRREERWRKDEEELGKKYRRLLEEVQEGKEGWVKVNVLRERDMKIRKEIEDEFVEQITRLQEEINKSSKEHEKAGKTAEYLAGEQARLRRLMQSAGRPPTPDAPP